MRLRFLFGVVFLALLAAPPVASAQGAGGGKPVLRQALVEVNPQPDRQAVTVDESFTIDGVTAGTPVKHVLATFPGVRIDGLRVTVGAAPVPTTTTAGTGAETVAFTAPHGGSLSYSIAYTAAQSGTDRVPILVPSFATDGSRVVRLRYNVPEGYHVQGEPFPIVIGTSGSTQRELVGVPSFLDYELGRESSSGWGFFSWMGVVIIVLSVVFSAIVMVREARAGKV